VLVVAYLVGATIYSLLLVTLFPSRVAVWVCLDCCYLGDIAIVDKQSGAVRSFRPGAK
jgi:hypothetical protein